jgi:hypothetical protein
LEREFTGALSSSRTATEGEGFDRFTYVLAAPARRTELPKRSRPLEANICEGEDREGFVRKKATVNEITSKIDRQER